MKHVEFAGGEIWTVWGEMNQNRTFHIPEKVGDG
jgi:hypothetical protein